MNKFYRIYRHDGKTPIIHPSAKLNWDITKRAQSAKVEVIRLGVQTNSNNTLLATHKMAMCWSPKWARSYTLLSFVHTDYFGLPEDHPTGYCSFSAIYYSKSSEGRFIITEHKPTWDNVSIVSSLDKTLNLNMVCR